MSLVFDYHSFPFPQKEESIQDQKDFYLIGTDAKYSEEKNILKEHKTF